MERIALLFPGQGSQFVGMGQDLIRRFPEAAKIFEEADSCLPSLNPKLSMLCAEGPEETLRLTMNAQPAIFATSMASYEVFKRCGWGVSFAAGHSVGEYAALAAAGALSFQDGLRLVRKRGELMREAGIKRGGTMAAILGMDAQTVESICVEIISNEKIVEVANLNSPMQIVISGDVEAVEKAGKLAKERGARRVIPLPVSGAFHSALMEEAANSLADELNRAQFHVAQFPVISNVTAEPVSEPDEIRTLLKRQIRAKVRWEETIRFLLQEGVSAFVEMEPGNVLSGLARSIHKQAKTFTLEEILKTVAK